MRRLTLGLLPFLLLLLCCLSSAAWGEASLYRGTDVVGSVSTTAGPVAGLWVSAEDVGALLGFSTSRSGEELRLTRGNVQLRLVSNAAAAWRGLSLVSLRAAPFERDGRWWMDAASTALLFQRDAGTGAQNRLRFRESSAQPTPPTQPETPAPTSIPTPIPTPMPTPTPAQAPKPVVTPAGQQARAQERREVFLPQSTARTDSHPSLNGGEILRLRWGSSQQKIRGVVDASDGADPQVWLEDGVVHALFASSATNPAGLPSPFENVRAELRAVNGGAVLTFASDSIRVEKLIMDSPRRVVFDFFLPKGARVTAAKPSAPASTPVIGPSPTPTPVPTPVPPPVRKGGKTGKKLVVVDPGHGGKDPGTAANSVREKDVNLAIGLELEKELKARGFDVVMTRRTDVYLKLQERTDIANRAEADVFVSVHVNALPSAKQTSGFEIYIMALPTDKDALALAKIENQEYIDGKAGSSAEVDRRTEMLLRILGDMQQNNKINESTGLAERLFEAGKRDGLPMRRVAQAPFFVLRGAAMPAVLLETGFVTNATEAKLLAHPGYRQRIAQAMADGIVNYLK